MLVVGQLGVGGTEKQVTLLARGLRDRGIDTSVWTLFKGGSNEEVLRRAGVPVVHVGPRHGNREVRSAAAYLPRFAALAWRLRLERPEVVHAFLFHAYVIAAPAARLAGVPVVVAGRRSLGNFKAGHPVALAVERMATSVTDLLIANAVAVAEDTKRNEHVRDSKIEIVYNGLHEQAFEPGSPAVIDTADPVVLCVANMRPYKGHRYLLEAISRLRDQGRPCTLVLAGDGGERRDLQHQACSLGIDARFLGECDDVGPLLARADVVALPSLEEGMSNAVMEAMAAGRAIVATSAGGTPELLRGRGLLVPPADPAALAEAIGQVLADRVLAAELGAAARNWSYQHLSGAAMVERHVQLYSGLLERRCAG